MKILFVGDTHGNTNWVNLAVRRTIEIAEPDAVFQLGDFGYRFADSFVSTCGSLGVPFYWLDGNHDDHDYLTEAKAFDAPSRFHELWPNVFYSPRGHCFEWDGVRFLTCGGAFSIDRAYRTKHVSWWPDELIRPADEVNCIQHGKVDVVLSHDAPADNDPLEYMLDNSGYKADPLSRKNREALSRITDATQPEILFHGHYHHRYDGVTADGRTQIVGLSCDGSGHDAFFLFDTEDYKKNRDEEKGEPDADSVQEPEGP